jgi:hypothetical protein
MEVMIELNENELKTVAGSNAEPGGSSVTFTFSVTTSGNNASVSGTLNESTTASSASLSGSFSSSST